MKFWRVFWKYDGESFGGYVRANTRTGAIRIAKKKLMPECIIVGCVEAFLFQITPQDITLNFQNESEYKYFG